MGKGGSRWGHSRGQAFSWVWLNHRRCSSGLRDKSWQLVRTSGPQPWGPGFTFQLSLLNKRAEAAVSSSAAGVTGGADGGQLSPPSVAPPPTLCPVGSGQALLPRGRNKKRRLGVNAQLCKRTHRARIGRVSTGLGNTVLSDVCCVAQLLIQG